MKIKKIAIIASGILCILLFVVSAGCTGNGQNTINGDVSIFASDELSKPLDDIIKSFNGEFKNIHTSKTYGTSSDLATKISSGNTSKPNVFIATSKNDIITAFGQENISIVPLTTKTENNEIVKEYQIAVIPDQNNNNNINALAAFTKYILGPNGKALFKYHGFTTPTNKK